MSQYKEHNHLNNIEIAIIASNRFCGNFDGECGHIHGLEKRVCECRICEINVKEEIERIRHSLKPQYKQNGIIFDF